MEPEQIQQHLKETGALLEGHFLLSSGLHSEHYVQCARVLAWPSRAGLIGSAIGQAWQGEEIDMVVGPAIGGIVIAHEVARYLGVPCIFTERENGIMTLRRGFSLQPHTKVLIVEDVVTTGKSVREVIQVVFKQSASVVGIGSIIWRAPTPGEGETVTSPFAGHKFQALYEMSFEANPPRECPQCQAGLPVEKPGSRPVNALS